MPEMALRAGGIALILGAALLGTAIVTVSFHPVVNQMFSPGVSRLFLLSAALLLVSLPAIYARQAQAAGWLGLAGHALLQTGVLFLVLVAATPILYPAFKQALGENVVAFALGIALTLGLLLTGIATIQAGSSLAGRESCCSRLPLASFSSSSSRSSCRLKLIRSDLPFSASCWRLRWRGLAWRSGWVDSGRPADRDLAGIPLNYVEGWQGA
jgi:hypothetical protein